MGGMLYIVKLTYKVTVAVGFARKMRKEIYIISSSRPVAYALLAHNPTSFECSLGWGSSLCLPGLCTPRSNTCSRAVGASMCSLSLRSCTIQLGSKEIGSTRMYLMLTRSPNPQGLFKPALIVSQTGRKIAGVNQDAMGCHNTTPRFFVVG